MADPLVHALVDVVTLEAVSPEADFTLALSTPFKISADSAGVAAAVFLLAFIDVLAVSAVSNVSAEADAAVAAQSVVATRLRVTAVQASETFVDVAAQQPVTLVTHATGAGEVVLDLQTLGLRVAPAADCLAVPRVSNCRETGGKLETHSGYDIQSTLFSENIFQQLSTV